MQSKLIEYLNRLKEEGQVISYCLYGREESIIRQISYDSSSVGENSLFVCKGAGFKERYLREAQDRGAVCYVSESYYPARGEEPYIMVKNIRKAMPVLGEYFYGMPQEKLKVIGVTGTKGKTTTSYYIKGILDEYLKAQQQKPAGLISSIEVYDGKERTASEMTTPESMELYRHLRNAVDTDTEYVAMEVSSQALKYHRVQGIGFDVGVFLNISEDHISPCEHEDLEDYFSSKLSLFRQARVGCVNLDSAYHERVLNAAKMAEKVITFGTKGTPDILGSDVKMERGEISFRVKSRWFDRRFSLGMHGLFNIENALAAIAVAFHYEIPVEYIAAALAKTKVSGRMEEYAGRVCNVTAIVDYAHNRLSFEKLFESILQEYPGHRIVSVFGCPGNKAINRRRDLGLVAGLYSDKVYLAADDPGEESVNEISKEIGKYIENVGCTYEAIEDRAEAIRKAVDEAAEGTIVLVLGKGSETKQRYGSFSYHYPTDAQIVRQSLQDADNRILMKKVNKKSLVQKRMVC